MLEQVCGCGFCAEIKRLAKATLLTVPRSVKEVKLDSLSQPSQAQTDVHKDNHHYIIEDARFVVEHDTLE